MIISIYNDDNNDDDNYDDGNDEQGDNTTSNILHIYAHICSNTKQDITHKMTQLYIDICKFFSRPKPSTCMCLWTTPYIFKLPQT